MRQPNRARRSFIWPVVGLLTILRIGSLHAQHAGPPAGVARAGSTFVEILKHTSIETVVG